jgi:indole-3-glycerol phosphate synthase
MSVLDRILERKRAEVAGLEREPGLAALRRAADGATKARGFGAALRAGAAPRVIAEFKRASPSKGLIRGDADVTAIARAYEEAGAAALSVLTDGEFFQGSLRDLEAARAACGIPLLRKDFVIHPIQLYEARAAGADAVLLIVAALDDGTLGELLDGTRALGLDALVEVHTREELERAMNLGATVVGINNRDLRSFQTDVAVTRELLPHTGNATVVSESGLDDPSLLLALASEGVDAFLVGEALMRAVDPGEALRWLRGSQ